MDDQGTNREGSGGVIRSLDKLCCILTLPVLANLSMWGALLVYPKLGLSDWFANNVFGKLLVAGVIAAIVGIIYSGYLSIRRDRQTAEVAICCFLSAIAIPVNAIGILVALSRIPRL